MKNVLVLAFFLISLQIHSQSNGEIKFKIDSLDLWNYDILKIDKNEKTEAKNPTGKIVFFRTTAVQDSSQKNIGGLKPAVLFYVYPLAMNPKTKEMAKRVSLTSSCQPPDRGGMYYILKNFVLLNYTSCTLCSVSTDKNTDLCKANIDRIVSQISNKEYKSFEQLCKDLPVKKGKYY